MRLLVIFGLPDIIQKAPFFFEQLLGVLGGDLLYSFPKHGIQWLGGLFGLGSGARRSVGSEWTGQQSGDSLGIGIPIVFEPENDVLRDDFPVGPEKPIPNSQHAGVIRVGFTHSHRMMHSVHIGAHQDASIDSVPCLRQIHIAMMKQYDNIEYDFVDDDQFQRDTQCDEYRDVDERGNENFAWMESESCRNIHFRIAMMDLMESPQGWNLVVHSVPAIYPSIEGDGSDHSG